MTHDGNHRTRLPIRPDLGLGRPIAGLFWAYLLWNVGFTLFATVWTVFVQRLGAEPAQVGLVVGAAVIGRTLLSYPAGVLAGRVRPLPIVAVSMALPVAGMLVLLVSDAWWQALVAAVLIELSGLGIPALSVWLASASAAGQQTRSFTYVYTVAPQAALLLGPLLGGVTADRLGFPAVFVAASALFTVSVLIVVVVGRMRAADGVVASPAGMNAHDQTPEPVVQAAPGENESVAAMLRRPAIRIVVLLHLLVPLVPFIGFVLLANFLTDERDISLSLIGTLGSVGAAAGLVASLVINRVSALRNPFVGIAASLVAGAVGLALLQVDGPVLVLVVAFMLRALLNPVWSFLSAAVAEVTPVRDRGRVFGLSETGAGVGDIAAPLAAGGLYQLNPGLPLVVSFLGTVPLAVWAWTLRHRSGAGTTGLDGETTLIDRPRSD